MIASRSATCWLCLCPLMAATHNWREAVVLTIGLLACVVMTAGSLYSVRGPARIALQMPLSALVAGTIAVLEHLALAAWWPSLDAEVAPWLALVAGLAVLVCCFDESLRDDRTLTPAPPPEGEGFKPAPTRAKFFRRVGWGVALSCALLLIGVARDGLGRVFLLAQTPAGALVLLALLLATVNFVTRGHERSSHEMAHSPLDSSPHPAARPSRALGSADVRSGILPPQSGLSQGDEHLPKAAGLLRHGHRP
jgi:hypothetical protein